MKTRNVSRVVLMNSRQEVLLLRHADALPADPNRPGLVAYWGTPGGGVEDGESFAAAAVRELEEETGIAISEPGPWIWTRERVLNDGDVLRRYHERYFLVRANVDGPFRDRSGEGILEYRWWSTASMRVTDEALLPAGIADFVDSLASGVLPSPPIWIE